MADLNLLHDALGLLGEAQNILTGQLSWQSIADSSNVAAAAYDPQQQKLYIRFRWGGTYAYDGVPDGTLDELLGAPSAGRYVNEVIKPQYSYERVS